MAKTARVWGCGRRPLEYVVERRVADVTFAHAVYFADREAALMPDFESPGPSTPSPLGLLFQPRR